MKYSNYIYTLIVSLVIGFFYNRYKRFEDVDEEKASYAMVQKYNMKYYNYDIVKMISSNKYIHSMST